MLIVSELEVRPPVLLDAVGIAEATYPGGVALVTQALTGEFTTPVVDPTLLYGWRGFEVFPYEVGISVALLCDGERYYYDQPLQSWDIDVTGALWNTPTELRAGLLQWHKSVQLVFKLTRLDGVSPRVQRYALGYEVTDTVMENFLEFALPGFLARPIEFTRRIEPVDGVTFPPLLSFDPARMSDLLMTLPGKRNLPATLVVDAEGKPTAITVATPIPNQMHRLVFSYVPKIVRLERPIFEVPEAPCITARGLDAINLRRVDVRSYVCSDPATKAGWMTTYVADMPVEITVIGETDDDCRRLVHALYQTIGEIGYVDLPAFALQMGITRQGDLKVVSNSNNQIVGSLFAHTFQILCRNVPLGEAELPDLTWQQVNLSTVFAEAP